MEKHRNQLRRLKDSLDILLDLQVIAEQGSIRRAAEYLYISQPALTRKLSRLEEVVQVPLLIRTPKGVILTGFGRTVVDSTYIIESELMRMLRAAEEIKENATGSFRVGTTPLPPAYSIGPAINDLRLQYPLLAVKIIGGHRSSQRARLLRAEIDIAIAAIPFGRPEDGFVYESIFEFSLEVVARAKHPLARGTNVTIRDLMKYQWILPARESGLYKRFQSEFRRAGAQMPDCAMEIAGSIEDARATLLSTDMLAILPLQSLEADLVDGSLAQISGEWCFGTQLVGAYARERSMRSDVVVSFLRHLKVRVGERTALAL